MLWTQEGQCDWWISAASEAQLAAFTAGLIDLPGLRDYLWSASDAGERLLHDRGALSWIGRHIIERVRAVVAR